MCNVIYAYAFNIARESTLNEMFQGRHFVRDLDDYKSLCRLYLSRLYSSLARKEILPEVRN